MFSACGRIQQPEPAEAAGVSIEMAVEPATPEVGPARLIFTLTGVNGRPLEGATLDIEGNMTHAGMVPVLAQAGGGQDGRYAVPFEWTMGGDWIITVEGTLADGRKFSHQIPVTVQ